MTPPKQIPVVITKTAWEWSELCDCLESAAHYEKQPSLAELSAYIRGFLAGAEGSK
jgi:hypothetical protein